MYTCVYSCILLYTRAYMHLCILVYTRVFSHIFVYTCVCPCWPVYTQCIHMYTCVYMHASSYVQCCILSIQYTGEALFVVGLKSSHVLNCCFMYSCDSPVKIKDFFCCIFQSHHHIQSAVLFNFLKLKDGAYMYMCFIDILDIYASTKCVWTPTFTKM